MLNTLKMTLLAVLITLPACTQTVGSGRWDDGVHAAQPKDIYVPDRMKLIDRMHESNVREAGAYRYANLVYEGNLPVTQVSSKVLENLPRRGFQLKERENPSADLELIKFQRGDYTLDCEIRRLEHTTRLTYKLRTHVK